LYEAFPGELTGGHAKNGTQQRKHDDQHFSQRRVSNAFTHASRELATAPPASGGIGGLIRLLSDPGVQEGLRLVSVIAARMAKSLRDIHGKGL
jgi:hypothetical protein